MRRIKKASIKFLSLVPQGANMLEAIYKSDGSLQIDMLHKELPEFDERGELLSLVYVPDHIDAQGDLADAEVIKEMAHEALRDGIQIDVQHNGQALPHDRAYVAESFIVPEGDPRFADLKDAQGEPVNAAGGWAAVIKILDPELRKEYREGKWNGVSMGGQAVVEPVTKADNIDTLAKRVAERLRKAIDSDQENDMTSEELKAALGDFRKDLKDELLKELKPEPTEDKTKETVAKELVFEGDPSNPEDVKAHLAKARAKAVDWSDPEAVAKYYESLTKEKPSEEPELSAEDRDRVAALEKELKELKRAGSNQSLEKQRRTEEDDSVALAKGIIEAANSDR